jgi:hypothetical protein
MLIIVFGPRERNVRTLPLYQVLGVSTVCTGIYMRIKHVSLFVLVLVLGWSAPASNQTSFGISAGAKVKSHVSKTAKKSNHDATGYTTKAHCGGPSLLSFFLSNFGFARPADPSDHDFPAS